MCHDSNWETLKRVRGGFSDRRLVLDLIRLSTLEAVKGAADDGERLEEHRERETKTPGAPADDWRAVLDRNRAAKKNQKSEASFPFQSRRQLGQGSGHACVETENESKPTFIVALCGSNGARAGSSVYEASPAQQAQGEEKQRAVRDLQPHKKRRHFAHVTNQPNMKSATYYTRWEVMYNVKARTSDGGKHEGSTDLLLVSTRAFPALDEAQAHVCLSRVKRRRLSILACAHQEDSSADDAHEVEGRVLGEPPALRPFERQLEDAPVEPLSRGVHVEVAEVCAEAELSNQPERIHQLLLRVLPMVLVASIEQAARAEQIHLNRRRGACDKWARWGVPYSGRVVITTLP